MASPPVPQLLHLVLEVVRDVDQDVGCPPRWRCHQPVLQNGLQEGHNLGLCSRCGVRNQVTNRFDWSTSTRTCIGQRFGSSRRGQWRHAQPLRVDGSHWWLSFLRVWYANECNSLSCQMTLNMTAISWILFIEMEMENGLEWKYLEVSLDVSPCGRTACSPTSSSSCTEPFRADGGTKSPDRVPCSRRYWRTDQLARTRLAPLRVVEQAKIFTIFKIVKRDTTWRRLFEDHFKQEHGTLCKFIYEEMGINIWKFCMFSKTLAQLIS